MKGGWFMGNFEPSLLKTEEFEICYKKFKKDEFHEKHYHKVATEYNFLSKGKILLNGQEIEEGQFFIMLPGEITDIQFLEDSDIFAVKVPSVKNDKYIVK